MARQDSRKGPRRGSHRGSKKSKREEPQGLGKSRALLLAVLVVVATVSAFFVVGGEEQTSQQAESVDDTVVEVAPMVPADKIVSASWHSDEQRQQDRAAAEEKGEDKSLFDDVEWGEDDGQRKYARSVERTVDQIQGLGIYVAPLDSEKGSETDDEEKD